jgi:GNAT superfamily N-acetyltransferase
MDSVPPPVTARLKDGRTIVIRALGDGDGARPNGLRALADKPRAERQGTAWTHFALADLDYLSRVDQANHIALIALGAAGDCAEIGTARCVRLAPGEPVGEIALTVLEPYRAAGAGGRLLGRMSQLAARRGMSRLHAVFDAEDGGVEHMLRRINARIDTSVARQKRAEFDAVALGELWSPAFAPLARLPAVG